MSKKPTLAEINSADYDQKVFQRIRVKRDWRRCPRCFKLGVRKDARKCVECGGRLLFPGDSGNDIRGNPITQGQGSASWFMWHRSIFGFEGWYDRSYFTSAPLQQPSGHL